MSNFRNVLLHFERKTSIGSTGLANVWVTSNRCLFSSVSTFNTLVQQRAPTDPSDLFRWSRLLARKFVFVFIPLRVSCKSNNFNISSRQYTRNAFQQLCESIMNCVPLSKQYSGKGISTFSS